MKKTTYFFGIWGLKGPKSTFDFDKFYGVHMAVKNLTFLAQ